ncbi:MAG: Niacin transporter NiaP, partial [uncultured Rubrobacteraceae bacterium]
EHRVYADRSGGHRPDRLWAVSEGFASRMRGDVGGGRRRGTLAGVRVAVRHRRVWDNAGPGWSDRHLNLRRDASRRLVLGDYLGLHRTTHRLPTNGPDLRRVRPALRLCTRLGMARGAAFPHGLRPRRRAPAGLFALRRVLTEQEPGT